MFNLPPRATIDVETRSECDLKKCGSWRYSLDPTTKVLCVAFRLPYWESGRTGIWYPAFPHLGIKESLDVDAQNIDDLEELFDWILAGNLVESHNFWFEKGIIQNILIPQYHWPRVEPKQSRCSAAKAAAHALQRALGDVALVLDTEEQKDEDGHTLMMKMTKPRKPIKEDVQNWNRLHAPCSVCKGTGRIQELKKDGTPKAKLSKCQICNGRGHSLRVADVPRMPVLWHESQELLEQLWMYCRQDVLAEESVSHTLPDLDPAETELYILDQIINERGFQLDTDAVTSALGIIETETAALDAELFALTEGQVERATQRDRVKLWFAGQGLELPNTQKATIEEFLSPTDENTPRIDLDSPVRRGLELVRERGKSSTSKYKTMQKWMCPDGRIRGGLLFHGAGTGRWSGAGVQPHNFVKGNIKDMATLWDVLKHGTREEIVSIYGSVMDALSQGLRGVIIASPGKKLYIADFNAIEARVVLWLAKDDSSLDIFRRNEDIYLDFASANIYNRPLTKADKFERDLGKIAVLGLGFQMGANKFLDTCAKFKITIDEEMAQAVVDAYRERFWRVKQMWYDQEKAAITAVKKPGRYIRSGRCAWEYNTEEEYHFLYCILPSGRKLSYPQPEIHNKLMPWGKHKDVLTFMGVNPYNRQWQRMSAYGGLIVENQTQAVARDLMAASIVRMEKTGVYEPILTVHDEGIAEAPEGQGNVKEFELLMSECPDWAYDLPVKSEGWSGWQYRK